MAELYVKKIRTKDGDRQIDYTALANLPDIYEKNDVLSASTRTALNISSVATPDEAFKKINDVLNTKSGTTHTHTLEDLGAAAKEHTHSTDDIVSGILPPERGGTGVSSLEDLWIAMGGSAERLVVEKIGISGTWTAPKATNQEFKVFVVGGGGGGQYRTKDNSDDDTAHYYAGGGGGGYINISTLIIPEGEKVTVVCGAGGAGGTIEFKGDNTYQYTDATDGGTTSFGSYISAAGGKRGTKYDGGDGGAGGGAGYYNSNYSHKGGNGDTYGGGGGGTTSGGNGGTYGGGGASSVAAGTGGEYGGNGGLNPSSGEIVYPENGKAIPISLIEVLFDSSYINIPLSGDGNYSRNGSAGGGGCCSHGGNFSSDLRDSGYGGGGGFCGNGGNGGSFAGGGGGGNYCSNGGKGYEGIGGGGGGLFADGGDGDQFGGGGGGGLDPGQSGRYLGQDEVAGRGGCGGVIIVYFKGD